MIDENMSKTDYELKVEEIMQNRFSDFDAIEDIEALATEENRCIIRTWKLMPTLWFMQRAWWRLYEMHSDDKDKEAEILIYYKPKCKTT